MENLGNINSVIEPLIKMVLILIVGHFIIAYVKKIIRRAFAKTKLDESLAAFLTKTFNIAMHLMVILSALNSIGVSTGSIVAALSAAVVAVGVALKDSLSNVAGGILLLISPRFHAGDYIETENDSGTVISVDLLHTTIRTPDNKQVSIPNGSLINSHITNYSREANRRVDITFPISYDADVETAKRIIKNVISEHYLVLQEPEEPLVRVIGYSDSSVNIVTRSWCKTPDYWNVYYDLTEQVRAALEKSGITLPYNQLDIHIREK